MINESIKNAKKVVSDHKEILKSQIEVADKAINDIPDEEDKKEMRDLLAKARRGEITADQIIKTYYGNRSTTA